MTTNCKSAVKLKHLVSYSYKLFAPGSNVRNKNSFFMNLRSEKENITNLLQPSGHVMHHQFNIQQLYALPTLYLCVLCLSENKQRLVPLTAKTDWFL